MIKDQRGFSLIELMFALGLSAVVIFAINELSVSQQQTYARQAMILDAQQSVRGAMTLMTKEIRMAGYDPEHTCLPDTNANVTPDGVSAATSTTITINSCTNTAAPTYDTIAYTRNASENTITRERTPSGGSSGGAQPLAEDITSVTFTFCDGSGTDAACDSSGTDVTGTTDQAVRDTIRRVINSMTASTGKGETRTLTSYVTMRNMKD